MGTEERLKGILARQTAAAEKAKHDQAAAQAAAERAKDLRVRVTEKWQGQRAHIEQFIDRLNNEMSDLGTTLFVRASRYPSDESVQVDAMDIGFETSAGDMRKLALLVRPDGRIYVSIATRTVSPVKHYDLNVLEATDEQLEGTVLDFLDENTPK